MTDSPSVVTRTSSTVFATLILLLPALWNRFPLLPDRHPASRSDSLDRRSIVADPSVHGPSDCAAGDHGGAGVDDGAAVAGESSADRRFLQSPRARAARAC